MSIQIMSYDDFNLLANIRSTVCKLCGHKHFDYGSTWTNIELINDGNKTRLFNPRIKFSDEEKKLLSTGVQSICYDRKKCIARRINNKKISVTLWYRHQLFVGESLSPETFNRELYNSIINWFTKYKYTWIENNHAMKVEVTQQQLQELTDILTYNLTDLTNSDSLTPKTDANG